MAAQTITIPQKVDGFSYNSNLRYLSNRFFPNALAQLDILRRAVNYRARWWVTPNSQNQSIAAFDTLFDQARVADGSYLWGWSFAPLGTNQATDVCIEVVDSCSGVPLFQDFVCGGALATDQTAGCYPVLLTQPRVILNPGLINIHISNRTANAATVQLILHFAEPCLIVEEESREQEMQRLVRSGAARIAPIDRSY